MSKKSNHRASFFKKKEHTPEFIESPEYQQCARKEKYESERIALVNSCELEVRYGQKLRVYKCKFCKKWHLTSRI